MTPEEKTAKIKEHQVTQDEIAKALGFYLLRNRSRFSSALNLLMWKYPKVGRETPEPLTDEEAKKVDGALSDILHNLNRNGGVYDARGRDIERLRGVVRPRYF